MNFCGNQHYATVAVDWAQHVLKPEPTAKPDIDSKTSCEKTEVYALNMLTLNWPQKGIVEV